MRENLGLQVAVILFAALCVVLSVSTYVYFSGYVAQRDKARQTAQQLRDTEQREQQLLAELQAVKYVVTHDETSGSEEIQQVHRDDVQRAGPHAPTTMRPTYQRLIGYLIQATHDAAAREVRTHADLLALREDLAQQTEQHEQVVAVYLSEAEERETQFAQQRVELEAEREQSATRLARIAAHAEAQSSELADARVRFDRMQGALSTQLTKLNQQYHIVRDRWEATQVDEFEHPDGQVTVADAGSRTVQVNLGRADGLRRGVLFQVYDPDAQGIVDAKEKAIVEITKVVGEHAAQGRIVRDTLSNPILSGDLVFTPLWQAGVQRQFCLLGILDMDGDGQDDGNDIRNLIRRQGAEVEAEVDADGRANGKLTAATRYVVVGRRPKIPASDASKGAYDRMLARAEELGIDQISVDKLLDYLNYRPAARRADGPARNGPAFRPRVRPRFED